MIPNSKLLDLKLYTHFYCNGFNDGLIIRSQRTRIKRDLIISRAKSDYEFKPSNPNDIPSAKYCTKQYIHAPLQDFIAKMRQALKNFTQTSKDIVFTVYVGASELEFRELFETFTLIMSKTPLGHLKKQLGDTRITDMQVIELVQWAFLVNYFQALSLVYNGTSSEENAINVQNFRLTSQSTHFFTPMSLDLLKDATSEKTFTNLKASLPGRGATATELLPSHLGSVMTNVKVHQNWNKFINVWKDAVPQIEGTTSPSEIDWFGPEFYKSQMILKTFSLYKFVDTNQTRLILAPMPLTRSTPNTLLTQFTVVTRFGEELSRIVYILISDGADAFKRAYSQLHYHMPMNVPGTINTPDVLSTLTVDIGIFEMPKSYIDNIYFKSDINEGSSNIELKSIKFYLATGLDTRAAFSGSSDNSPRSGSNPGSGGPTPNEPQSSLGRKGGPAKTEPSLDQRPEQPSGTQSDSASTSGTSDAVHNGEQIDLQSHYVDAQIYNEQPSYFMKAISNIAKFGSIIENSPILNTGAKLAVQLGTEAASNYIKGDKSVTTKVQIINADNRINNVKAITANVDNRSQNNNAILPAHSEL